MTTMTHAATIELASDDFNEGAMLPNALVYDGIGYDGENRSPALAWSSVPAGTKSLVLTMHDPDAPTTVGFTHWILYDIDPKLTRIEAGAGAKHRQPHGATLGLNDFGETEYLGPCPPKEDAPHRYRFTLYALDLASLETPGHNMTYPRLRFMIRNNILAKGMIMGRFGA